MRVTVVLVAALVAAACSSSKTPTPPPGPSAGSGGQAPAAGTGGGGAGGTGGVPAIDAAPVDAPRPAVDASAAVDQAPATASPGGSKVLFIGGASPMIGTDALIHQALKARSLEVQDVRETATPADAQGARLVIMSYSMQSTDFKAEPWADLAVPIMVLEHFLLPRLGMTTSNGFQQGVSAITILSDDPVLAAGLPMGDVTVYTPQGKEMFWGVPGPGAIKVAAAKGSPNHFVYFAYPAGAMMPTRPAPAKRMQFFVASHAPPPVNDQFLNADGLKLLGGAIDWLIR
jgi:hypothetical protein